MPRTAYSVERRGKPFAIRYALSVIVFLSSVAYPPSPIFAAQEKSLLATIEAAEEIDAQIAALTKELKSVKTLSQRKELQAPIEELQRRQQELLNELEELVGPPPPTVATEKPVPLEEQMKAKERRHETTLDSKVDKR